MKTYYYHEPSNEVFETSLPYLPLEYDNWIIFYAEERLTTDLDFPDFHTPKKEIKPGHYVRIFHPAF